MPGDKLEINTEVKIFKRGMASFEGRGTVKGQTVCQAEFNLILPEEIKNYNMKTKMPIASSLLNKPRLVKVKRFLRLCSKK